MCEKKVIESLVPFVYIMDKAIIQDVAKSFSCNHNLFD